MEAWIGTLLGAITAMGAWRFAVAAVGMFCETSLFIGLLVPGDTIVLLSSTANRSAFDFVVLLVAVVVGSLGGESVGFAIGTWFGPRLRTSRLGRRVGEAQWVRAESWLARRGGPAVFLSRFLPVLHALVPVTAGMGEMRYRRFMTWSAPACLLWALIYIALGTAAGSSYRQLSSSLHLAGWVFFGIIAAGVAGMWLGKRLLHRFEQRTHETPKQDL